ncbi:MAG: hypothetical protein ACI8RC_002892 [Ilumatobacter sp.]|jgi:hypothetical protein
MTKLFRTLIVIALIGSAAACGSSESDVATTDSLDLGQLGDVAISLDCLESEEAFDDCLANGDIPDECIDGDGLVLDACFESEGVSDDDAANESDATRSLAIPAECFTDEEAFDDCWQDGSIPDECVDADGFIVDSCFPSDDEGSSEAASQPTPALGVGSVSSGFDPAVDAFSFANYGDDTGAVDLTVIEMQRMFGDGVCANLVDGCTLAPPARQWMEQMNKYMAGGHCEGMAVLSSLFYFGDADPSAFGADSVRDLEISGNDALQREIAYWWVTQGTSPGASQSVSGSPSEVLDTLVESFSDGQQADESWSLGIFKRDGTGGHAVTPYAVEENGDGTYKVFVYDNNYPSQGRVLTIDRDANTWQYEASTNPNVETDLYEGDADTDTLSVHPASPRIGPQEAAFGADGEISGYATVLQAGTDGIEIWLDGDANLLITALDGRRLGWLADGSFVNEIEGATATDLKFGVAVWEVDQEPVYVIPGDITDFSVTIDGSQLDEQAVSSVTMIGSDFNMVVEDVVLDPGEWDLIEVSVVDGDYLALNYSSDYADSPEIWFGLSTDDADYEFIVRGSDIEPGGSFNVILDYPNGDFILDTTEQTEFGIYELLVARIDDEGEYVFGNEDIELQPDDTLYVNFFEWEGDGSPMYLDFDFGSDGSIDETLALEDEAGLAEDFFEE